MPSSNAWRITLGAAVSIALIGALAMYLRRRKRRPTVCRDIYLGTDTVDSARSDRSDRVRKRLNKSSVQNGGASYTSSPATTLKRTVSTGSIKSDADSASTVIANVTRSANLTPPQLFEVGVELLNRARSRWELAVQQIDEAHAVDAYSTELRDHLRQLLELADRVRMQADIRLAPRGGFLSQVCTSAAIDAALDEMDREYEQQMQRRRNNFTFDDESSSDLDSFVSALDMADLSDLDDQRESFQNLEHLALYEAALLELSQGSVPCRVLRTKTVKCATDTEFFAKLHCVRLAFTELFADTANGDFFVNAGRDLFATLLINAQRDADEFYQAYDTLIAYVRNRDNTTEMEDELRSRGVKVTTFYDIVIDFILFDAFDDLENPPSSLISVMQNRWLTSGFKETALTTAVWSVLKAKRKMLKYPKGFVAHFYAVSETISPTLAWGFLGPDGPLKDMCNFFKNQVLEFSWDIFNFDRVRYTNVEVLAADIMRLARKYAEVTKTQLSAMSG